MKRMYPVMLSFVVGCTLLLAARPAAAEDAPVPSARRLPSRVFAYMSVRNTTELKQKFGESLSGQLLKHPDLAPIRENIEQLIAEKSQGVEEKLGVSLQDLLSIPQGEIALAVIQPPGQQMAPVALIDFGDKGSIVNTVLEKIADGMQDQGIERSTEEYEGDELVLLRQAEGDLEPGQTGFDLAYCIKDNVLVVGKGSAAVKTVLTRWDGEHDNTLMGNEVYSYLVKKCSADDAQPLLTWYVDPMGLLQVALAGEPQAAMIVGFLPVLGMNNLKAAGGTMSMMEGDFDSVSRTLFYMEQPTSGLLEVFNFPAEAQTPPAWAPKNATSFMAINWGIGKAYRSIETLIDTFRGPGALSLMLDQLSDEQFNGDLHLKEDVLDLLTGKIRVIGDTPNDDDPAAVRALYALEVSNADDAKAVLAKIAALDGFPGETREFRGETIYEFTAPATMQGPLNPNAGGEEQLIGVAVVKGYLMVGVDVTILEQVIRGDADAGKLTDSEDYQSIAKFFPEKTSAVTYTQTDASIKTGYELLRSGNAGFLLGDALQDIDLSQLPDFQTISKFLPPRGSFLVPDERGYFLQSFTPKPAE